MKKIILISSFILLFLKPLNVRASFLPPVLPTNTNSVVDFIVSSAMTDLAQNGVKVANSEAYDTLNRIINGQSIFESTTSSYLDLGANNFTLSTNLYDSQGNLINQSDAYMALIQTDAGTATAIYSKETGEALLMGDSFSDAQSTIISGQIGTGQTSRFPLTEPILTNRISNNGVFTSPTLSQEVREEFQSYAFSGYARSTYQGFICFVPNGCSTSTRLLPNNGRYTVNISGSGDIGSYGIDYVTDDPSTIQWVNPDNSSYATSKQYSRSYGGKTWQYTTGWYNSYNPFWQGGEIYFHAPTDAEYNALKNSEVVYTEPVNNVYEVTNNYYEYTTYNDNRPTYSSVINQNYDRESDITPDNYPKDNNVYIPQYPDIYNYYNEYVTYINQPSIGDDIGNIDSEDITNGLPILNNLSKRFPFSIPFDIYNLLKGLSVQRETPYINTDVVIPAINYTWHIEYDLHDFDDIAELFRILFLISFILSLAYFSYDHFFGE